MAERSKALDSSSNGILSRVSSNLTECIAFVVIARMGEAVAFDYEMGIRRNRLINYTSNVHDGIRPWSNALVPCGKVSVGS